MQSLRNSTVMKISMSLLFSFFRHHVSYWPPAYHWFIGPIQIYSGSELAFDIFVIGRLIKIIRWNRVKSRAGTDVLKIRLLLLVTISSVCWKSLILLLIHIQNTSLSLATRTELFVVRCSFSLLSRLACQSVSGFLSRRMMWEVIIEQVPQSNLQRLGISQTYSSTSIFYVQMESAKMEPSLIPSK